MEPLVKNVFISHLALHQKDRRLFLDMKSPQNENNASWSTLLDKLQNQGIQQVSLVVTDGFKGLEEIINQAYPLAKQQRCLIHISRNLASKVKRADRAVILEQFKTIYRAENLEMAVQALENFIAEWKPKYRKVMESLENTDNLLTFFSFPIKFGTAFIRQASLSLLTKKSNVKRKRRFFFLTRRLWNVYLVTLFEDYNFKQSQRIHKGFGQCSDTLESLFD